MWGGRLRALAVPGVLASLASLVVLLVLVVLESLVVWGGCGRVVWRMSGLGCGCIAR